MKTSMVTLKANDESRTLVSLISDIFAAKAGIVSGKNNEIYFRFPVDETRLVAMDEYINNVKKFGWAVERV